MIIEELVVEKERQIELIGLNVEDALLVLELMAPDEVNGELNGLAIEQHKSCNADACFGCIDGSTDKPLPNLIVWKGLLTIGIE